MAANIKNRHRLKQREIRELLNQLTKEFTADFFGIKSSVEIGDLEGVEVVLIDNDVDFMRVDGRIFFTLPGLYKYRPQEHIVVVDMGAVPFVTNGADIMAAGIVDADAFIEENDQVWICDETHRRPLAVGVALISGEEMIVQNKGKAIKNIHYVGDSLWNHIKIYRHGKRC